MPVYAFRKSGSVQIKIGVSVDVDRRLMTLQHAGGTELTLFHQVDTAEPYKVERELHLLYRSSRSKYGEWFDIPEDQEDELKDNMNRLAAESRKALGSGTARQDHSAWLREPLADAFAASLRTPEELAADARVSTADIERILHGKANLTHAKVLRIANALRVNLVAITSTAKDLTLYEHQDPDLDAALDQAFGPNRTGRKT